MSVGRSASALSGSPSAATRASRKRSIGLPGSPGAAGTSGRTIFRNDQCCSYGAPAAIQRVRRSFWAAESSLWKWGGGMTVSGSVAAILAIRALAAVSPGTIARSPLSREASAAGPSSSLKPASCLPGPWQAKQCSESSGRMSRSNRIGFSAPFVTVAGRIPTARIMPRPGHDFDIPRRPTMKPRMKQLSCGLIRVADPAGRPRIADPRR